MNNDPYSLHRLAIKPLLSPSPEEELEATAGQIQETGESIFLSFLDQNMLTPLWHETLAEQDAASLFSKEFTEKLHKASFAATARYMHQQNGLNRAVRIFDAESIPYTIYKGGHIREIIYKNQAVRISDDIDILIAKPYREKALQAFSAAGYDPILSPDTISHEAVVSVSNVKIDLHWDILRPGRTRFDMTEKLLAHSQRLHNYWMLGPEEELFIMLVHPVITKYLTAPQASLIRVVDMVKWIETQKPDWQKLYDLLEQSGLKTAAWIHAYWLHLLTGRTLPEKFVARLKPAAMKGTYLRTWINRNYSTRFLNNPFLIKAGFTLPVHDSLSDALRAYRSLQHEMKIAQAETDKIKSSIS